MGSNAIGSSPAVLTTSGVSSTTGQNVWAALSFKPGALTDTVAFTDSSGNTWVTDIVSIDAGFNIAVALGRTNCNVAGLSIGATITGTITSTGTPSKTGICAFKESREVAARGPVNQTSSATTTTASPITAGTATPTFDRCWGVNVFGSTVVKTGTPSAAWAEQFDISVATTNSMQVNTLQNFTTSLAGVTHSETMSSALGVSQGVIVLYEYNRKPSPIQEGPSAAMMASVR